MPPIQEDGATNELSEHDAAEQFLSLLADKDDDASKKKPSEPGTNEDEPNEEANDDEPKADESEETPDEEAEGDDETEGETEDEGDEDKPAKEKKFADDDETYVKVKVGDEEHEVPVKDLKRLFGQEASLTRKGQELAQERTKVDESAQRNLAAYNIMLKRAEDRAAPYKAINWMALSKDPNISAEEATALHAEATRAFEEERFIKSELDGFMGTLQVAQKEEQGKAAQACIKLLSSEKTDKGEDNPLHIKGWGEPVYNEVRAFATTMGVPKETVNQLTDPAAFKIIHMAMQFQKGAQKVQTVKVNKAPKKIVKQSASPVAARPSSSQVSQKQAMKRLESEQSQDAAADAFLARITGEK